MVSIMMIRNSTDPHGTPLFKHQQYRVGVPLALKLIQKKAAAPALDAMIEKLAEAGLLSIRVVPDSEQAEELVEACKRVGLDVITD